MNLKFPILLSFPMLLASCGQHQGEKPAAADDIYALRAAETLDSVYARYGADSTCLLRENYPFAEDYEATYLASETSDRNAYSYLWPFSGTLSAISALYEATGDSVYIDLWDNRAVPGLEHYFDTCRKPPAYASYINTASPSDRFYDDNVWLGIDFTDMYNATGKKAYLDRAESIWKFIESGTDDVLDGGIYWCEQKKNGKNTCSNAPGAVYALKLFNATADSTYLEKGKSLYDWTVTHLQDPEDKLYFDNINLSGEIGKAKFAYNSGQMLQAAALLHKITGDSIFLTQAQEIASAAHKRFFNSKATDDEGEFNLLMRGDIWFTAVMMRGFAELYSIDGNPEYMEDFRRNLDYAWTHMRDSSSGLFNTDWSGDKTDETKWLLTQAAMSEMYARIASYNKNRK